jgi:hypothetical protein
MQTIIEREDLSADERLKLYDQSLTRYLNVHDDYRPRPVVSKVSTSPPAVIETETKDVIEEEILESVPKTMKTKAELLVWKMKSDPNIACSEKGELKYKGETVRGSKRKYFNPQGWETFGEALREANVPQDLIGHEDRFSSPFSLQAMLGSAFIFRTNSSALVFIVFGTLSNISSSIASFVSVSITAGGDVDTFDTTDLGL